MNEQRRDIDWALDHEGLRSAQDELLGGQLQRVWERSEFLRGVWTRGGFTRSPRLDEFESLPLIAKSDLRAAMDAGGFLGTHLACERADVAHVHATSGTSGRPTYFGLTARDFDAWMRIFIRGFELCGARPGDVILHAFAMSRGYAGGAPMVRAFEQMGCTVLALGAEAGSARLSDVIVRLAPDLLYASPSMLRRLAERYAEETGEPAASTSMTKIITGGEPGAGDPTSKRALTQGWGAQVREAGGGSDICPLMWAECDEQDGLHFVAGDEVLFEVVDPETARPLDLRDGMEGEIVYTHLRRQANPLVRMRHGDIVQVTVGACGCGRLSPRIHFRGRADEILIVRGVKIFPSSVQSVVSEFVPRLTGSVAIRQRSADASERPLEILCEWNGAEDAEELAGMVERRARDLLGVRVDCRLVGQGEFGDKGQKARWIVSSEANCG